MPSTTQSKTPPDSRALLIRSTVDAVNAAALGESCVDELRSVLQAILSLSRGDEVIHGLAKVGFNLACDRHNLLDCEREGLEQKLLVLKGASDV